MVLNGHIHLEKHGVKPSHQRIAIMEYLLQNKTHPTADEIYVALHPDMPTLSKTTVYNTLKLLAEQGAALSIAVDEKNIRYDGMTEDHAHFKCLRCGKIFDIAVKASSLLAIKRIRGFKVMEMQLMYKGYCRSCKVEVADGK